MKSTPRLVIYFSRLNDKEKAAIVESVDREFEAESKPNVDNKMEQDEARTKSASSKDERMNKLKAEKGAAEGPGAGRRGGWSRRRRQ